MRRPPGQLGPPTHELSETGIPLTKAEIYFDIVGNMEGIPPLPEDCKVFVQDTPGSVGLFLLPAVDHPDDGTRGIVAGGTDSTHRTAHEVFPLGSWFLTVNGVDIRFMRYDDIRIMMGEASRPMRLTYEVAPFQEQFPGYPPPRMPQAENN